MPKYKMNCTFTVGGFCVVEADSEEEAIAKAADMPAEMGFPGCGYTEEDSWLVEEIDGMPDDIRVVEEIEDEDEDEEE